MKQENSQNILFAWKICQIATIAYMLKEKNIYHLPIFDDNERKATSLIIIFTVARESQ